MGKKYARGKLFHFSVESSGNLWISLPTGNGIPAGLWPVRDRGWDKLFSAGRPAFLTTVTPYWYVMAPKVLKITQILLLYIEGLSENDLIGFLENNPSEHTYFWGVDRQSDEWRDGWKYIGWWVNKLTEPQKHIIRNLCKAPKCLFIKGVINEKKNAVLMYVILLRVYKQNRIILLHSGLALVISSI